MNYDPLRAYIGACRKFGIHFEVSDGNAYVFDGNERLGYILPYGTSYTGTDKRVANAFGLLRDVCRTCNAKPLFSERGKFKFQYLERNLISFVRAEPYEKVIGSA